MWTSKCFVHAYSMSRLIRTSSTVSSKIARLNCLLEGIAGRIHDPLFECDDLAKAIRDDYFQLPRPSMKPVDRQRFEALLLFADSSSARRDNQACLPGDAELTSNFSILPRRKTRSMKRHISRNYTIVDFIFSRDVQKGIEFIVAMREDIFQARKMTNLSQNSNCAQMEISKLNELDNDLKELLRDWFCPDMMGKLKMLDRVQANVWTHVCSEIRRISYNDSTPSVLERIVHKEAVHPIQNPQDLRDRLGKGKRVFALFSPLLPDRPLVFCHVALTEEVPNTLEYAAASTQEDDPKVATFYSITNGETGLVGLQLGLFLLKLAMQTLRNNFPSITEFVTLSPMPNFRQWVESYVTECLDEKSEFIASSTPSPKRVLNCGRHSELVHVCQLLGEEDPKSESFLTKLEATMQSGLVSCETRVAVDRLLRRLACQYLLPERDGGISKCRVARFHIGNGAEVYRINIHADLSEKGMNQSFGFMVNYRYDTSDVI